MTKELTASQRNARKQIGRLERRVKRTNETQAQRKEQIAKLKSKA